MMARKLHRHLRCRKIYTAIQGWGHIYGDYEYHDDTATDEEPQSEPYDTPPSNARNTTKTELRRDWVKKAWQCICDGIYPEEEYVPIKSKNRED